MEEAWRWRVGSIQVSVLVVLAAIRHFRTVDRTLRYRSIYDACVVPRILSSAIILFASTPIRIEVLTPVSE